jgi:hypothetical protein
MGLQRINQGKIRVDFIEPLPKKLTNEDKLPEGVTEEELKEKYSKLVWCEFYDCKWNKETGAERTLKTILKNKAYTPFADDPGMRGLCSRPDEIAIRFKTIVSGSMKYKVPACFLSNTGVTGHVDFSKFLQPDGSPWGGNIDSQHVSDDGYGAMEGNSIYGD